MNRPLRAVFSFLALAGAIVPNDARAAIVDDFLFAEPDNSPITSAANSANAAHTFLSEESMTPESKVIGGAYRILKTTPTTQVGNTFDVNDVAAGKIWLVAELKGWSYTGTASSPSERVRFAFLDNATPSAGSNTITAEMNLDRSGANLTVTGDAGGTGSTATIPGTAVLSLTRNTPLTMVLEVDATAETYSVYYKDNLAPFSLVGTGNLGDRSAGVKREPRSVRFAYTGVYDGAQQEFVDVDRIYVTDANPVPEPASWLLVACAAGILRFGRRS